MNKINFYGDGIRVWVCDLAPELYKKLDARRRGIDWELVLFDFDFLTTFGLSHWSELAAYPEIIGLKISAKSIIEIKKGNKKLGQFKAIEIVDHQVLFPLYNTIYKNIEPKPKESRRIIILEYETGLTHSVEIGSGEIYLNELNFHLQEFGLDLYCIDISINNKKLTSVRNDTVTRGVKIIIN